MSAENRFINDDLSVAAYIRGQEIVAREVSTNRFYPFGLDYVSPGDKLLQDNAEAPRYKIVQELV